MSKVLVTGAGGYIGTQLVRDLVAKNHQVVALDRYFFGMEPMNEFLDNNKVEIVKQDIRDVTEKDFAGIDAVCDLACLSNDPAGEMDPVLTFQINRDGRIHVAKTAKKAGVAKYIISSSCSVYGQGETPKLTEESSTKPISVYAKSTLEAEQENLSLSDNNFSVTSLRNATVFGLSKRMRFDLVVNLMTLSAFQKKRIIVMGGGSQWRPLIHVSDVSKAFVNVIESKDLKLSQEVFNIGLDNFQIKDLAFLVREQLPFPIDIDVAPDDADKRNYNVIFDKATQKLNFKAENTVISGILEIYNALKQGTVDVGLKTITVQWYRNLLEAKKLLDTVSLNDRII
jgi:nucleoside-diphosphate-sugar epimerase